MWSAFQVISDILEQSYKAPFNDPISRTFAFLSFFWILRYLSAARVRYFHSKKRLDGKVAIVTGANRGLGKETSKELAKRGCTVILACRNVKAAEAAKAEILADTKLKGTNTKIQVLHLDVSSFKSIKSFASQFGSRYERLDLLIHNAGYLSFFNEQNDNTNSRQSNDGVDLTMATNFYGPFLLTHLLLNKMRQSTPTVSKQKPTTSSDSLPSTPSLPPSSARVIYVTSNFYSYATIDSLLDNNNTSDSKTRSFVKSIPLYKYFQSKCAAVAILQEFTHRLKSMGDNDSNRRVTFNCVCPGSVNTDLFRHTPARFRLDKIYSMIRKHFFKTPNEGVQTLMYAAISDELEGVSGKYFIDNREEKLHACVKDEELRRKLWDHAVKIVNLKE